MNKPTWSTNKELLELVEMEVREFCPSMISGDDTPIVIGSALKAMEGDTARWARAHHEAG